MDGGSNGVNEEMRVVQNDWFTECKVKGINEYQILTQLYFRP